MLFCPRCANLLLIKSVGGSMMFTCSTCSYVYHVSDTMKNIQVGTKKIVSEVESEKETGEVTESGCCPECRHNVVRFYTKQIRSADEPETIFYTCTKCFHKWRE
uniref:DNA-directed RNA polymerase subunit n=1 Tax=Arcella intermedia TaxID=1963864 RepID=A0A6B2LTI0_9EUKA